MLHKQEEMGALGIWKQNYKDKMGGGGGRTKEREGKRRGTKMTVHRVYLNPGNTACPVKTV